MSKYYITIFSLASIITGSLFLTSHILHSSNNIKVVNDNNLNLATKTSSPTISQPSVNLLTQKNQWRQQLNNLQEDLKKFQKNGDIEQEIQTINLIVMTYTELGEYSQALEYLQLAQSKLNQLSSSPEKKSLIESELLMSMGTIYADQGNYTQVLEVVRKIDEITNIRLGLLGSGIGNVEDKLEKKKIQPDVRQDAQKLYIIAIAQKKRGKNSEALRTAEEALKMIKIVKDQEGEKEVTRFINTLRQQL